MLEESEGADTGGEEERFEPFEVEASGGSSLNAYEHGDEVGLREGGAHLVQTMSNWFIPRPTSVPVAPPMTHLDASTETGSDGSLDSPSGLGLQNGWSISSGEYARPANVNSALGPFGTRSPKQVSFRERKESTKIDITFATAEMSLKRDLKRQYLAVAIGCWGFLTTIQSVSLVCLNYWEYSPVVIGIILMTGSTVFYWKYVWGVLNLPFRRLWDTPYPFAISAAVLGSLAQHAMFLVYNGYAVGQLLIVFFLVQAFYLILVASTYRNYLANWQKFINHRRLCFDALQLGRAKQVRP